MIKATKRLPRARTARKWRAPMVRPAAFKCRITDEARALLEEVKQLSDEITRRDFPEGAHTGAPDKQTVLGNELREFAWEKAKSIVRRRRLSVDDLTTLSLLYCVTGGMWLPNLVSVAIAKAAGAKLHPVENMGRHVNWRVTLPR